MLTKFSCVAIVRDRLHPNNHELLDPIRALPDRDPAALSAATTTRHVVVDLRVESADTAGNTVRWTQGAVSIGDPPETPRRRSARK